MANQSTTPAHDELFDEWHKGALLQRMLLPRDFLTHVHATGMENFWCRKTTTERLSMMDREKEKTITVWESRKFSTDMNYRPQKFKAETLRIIRDSLEVPHGKCSGTGNLYCPDQMDCRWCGGRGQRDRNCERCNGKGRVELYSGGDYFRCSFCGGRGKYTVECSRCNRGRVVCNKCNGRGYVVCDGCEGLGKLVRAKIITRKFLPRTEVNCKLPGLAANEFKNGLTMRHFKYMTGDLVRREFQPPAKSGIVLQRQSVHSYDVLSHRYSYKGTEFWLNKIASGSGLKYVSSSLPFSKTKTAVAGAIFFATTVAISALVTFL